VRGTKRNTLEHRKKDVSATRWVLARKFVPGWWLFRRTSVPGWWRVTKCHDLSCQEKGVIWSVPKCPEMSHSTKRSFSVAKPGASVGFAPVCTVLHHWRMEVNGGNHHGQNDRRMCFETTASRKALRQRCR